MHFILDEDLPRSSVRLLRQYGHEATDVRDTNLRGASDSIIADYAQKNQLCLITADTGFADIRNYPPANYYGIVVLQLPAGATSSTILSLLKTFLDDFDLVNSLSKKLAIVGPGRVRVRQG